MRYTYQEIREAMMAFLRMGYGDFKGEEYIDSLSKASQFLKEEDESLNLFTRMFEDFEIVRKLNVLGHLEEEYKFTYTLLFIMVLFIGFRSFFIFGMLKIVSFYAKTRMKVFGIL